MAKIECRYCGKPKDEKKEFYKCRGRRCKECCKEYDAGHKTAGPGKVKECIKKIKKASPFQGMMAEAEMKFKVLTGRI